MTREDEKRFALCPGKIILPPGKRRKNIVEILDEAVEEEFGPGMLRKVKRFERDLDRESRRRNHKRKLREC